MALRMQLQRNPQSYNVLPCEQTKHRRNPCSAHPLPPPVYQNLRTRHDWPLKKAIVDLPIRLKGNSTLLTEVKLRLPHAQANLLSGQDKPP